MRTAEGRKGTKRKHRGLLGLIGVALLRDTARATAKSVAGIGTPPAFKRTTRARVFFCAAQLYLSVMTGWAGQPHGWPVSLDAR
ncbi:ash family protein [Aeromonas veronii]